GSSRRVQPLDPPRGSGARAAAHLPARGTGPASGVLDAHAESAAPRVPATALTGRAGASYARGMTLRRMDHVGIVVDDLKACMACVFEVGLELEVQMPVEGRWVDRVVGLDVVRVEIAMMRTPDGHGRLELTKFHSPMATGAEPRNAPANTLGIRRIM